MKFSDVTLLLKILVGIIVTLIPFLILFGGWWLTQKLLNREKQPETELHRTKTLFSMKMEPRIARRIFRNVLVSLFIYALPVLLMLLSFYVSGDKAITA